MRSVSAEDVRVRGELDLLLCCARTSVEPRQAAKLADLGRPGIDWARLLRLAEWHRVLPLLRLNLRRSKGVPTVVLAHLDDEAHLRAQHNLLLSATLRESLAVLEGRGIAAMPFKGPALAVRVYGEGGLRHFDDLDLFVRRRHLLEARHALVDAGFMGALPDGKGQLSTLLRSENQLGLCREGVHIDLHWEVVPRAFAVEIDLEDLWQRAEVLPFLGRPITSFSPEDVLVLLCIHGAKHQWQRIGWICDVAELVRSSPHLSWQIVRSRAEQSGTARMVRLGLLLAADLLDLELPSGIDEWIRADRVVHSLALQVGRECESDHGIAVQQVDRARFHMAARERWSDKLQYVWRTAVTPGKLDWTLLPLPRWLAFVYSCLRPIRLGLTYRAQVPRVWRAAAAIPHRLLKAFEL